MTIYSTKCRLSSCKVGKSLLEEVEKYILKEAENYLAGGSKEKIDFDSMKKEMYHVLIQGKEEAARYESVAEYKDKKLPGDTSMVNLEFVSLTDRFFHIKVHFHKSISEHPVVEISVSDLKAKDISKSIADGIANVVKEHRNSSGIFHNKAVQMGLLFFYAMYTIAYFVLLNYSQLAGPYFLSKNIIFALVFGMIILWFIVSIFMRRYTTFDTERQKIINISYWVFTLLYLALIAAYIIWAFSRYHH